MYIYIYSFMTAELMPAKTEEGEKRKQRITAIRDGIDRKIFLPALPLQFLSREISTCFFVCKLLFFRFSCRRNGRAFESLKLVHTGLYKTDSIRALCQCAQKIGVAGKGVVNMKYSLGSVRDEVSFALGIISIIGWSVAEIPQIITNYREKSAESLSLTFLLTWTLGDLFNLFGCWLEPATLPTQYYMAVLYVVTCGILTAQALYYGHIYPRLKYNRRQHKDPKPNKLVAPVEIIPGDGDIGGKQVNEAERSNGSVTFGGEHILSSPIPLPRIPQSGSLEREVYYMSARSLSRGHTPPAATFLAQRKNYASLLAQNSIEEPLLGGLESRQSTPPPSIKTTLCVVSVMSFLGIYNFHRSADSKLYSGFKSQNEGFVIQVGRKLLQARRMVGGGLLQENGFKESLGIGSFLGWGMAVLYMGGRLPQIFLNIKRGNAEGLNPFMFIFALVGNATYIASILVSSLDWSKIKPNLPWLVDAGGCLLLDTVILYQFFYFRHWKPKENKFGHYNASLDDQEIV